MNSLQINIYLGGDSSKIENRQLIISAIARAGAALGMPIKDHTSDINQIRGFGRLADYILSQQGIWVCNDTLPIHLFMDGFPHPYIQISRDISWVTSTPQKNCIGLYTQQMFNTTQSLPEIVATIATCRPISLPEGFNTFHVTSDYEPSSNETIGRHGIATASWVRVAKADIHYRFDFFTDEDTSLPRVWDIFSLADATTERGSLIIFTNRDICLVPESIAIIRAFMLNRDIKTCYGSRVDITELVTLTHADIAPGVQYPGIDLFAWYAGSLPEATEAHKNLLLAREGWDSAFRDLFGGETHKIPYNVCYHVMHESPWMTEDGIDGNNENYKHLSEIGTKTQIINGGVAYSPDNF